MRVALKAALGVAVGLLVAGQVPDDESVIATARKQHVGAKIDDIESERIVHIATKHKKTCFPYIYQYTHVRIFIYVFHPCANHR